MRILTTLKFPSGLSESSWYDTLFYKGERVLIFDVLSDGTRRCLRLDGLDMSLAKDPWGEDHLYVGSIDASPDRAFLILSNP